MAGHFVLAQAATPHQKSPVTPIIIPALPATPLPRLAVEPDAPGVSQAISQKSQGPQEPEPSLGIDQQSTPSPGAQQTQLPTQATAQAAQPETAKPAGLPPGVIDWPARNFTSESGPGGLAPSPIIHEPGEGQAQAGSSGEGPATALPVPTAFQGIVPAEASPTIEASPTLESKSALQTTEPLKANKPSPPQKTEAPEPNRNDKYPPPKNTQNTTQNNPPPALQTTNPKPPTKIWTVITNLFFSIFRLKP